MRGSNPQPFDRFCLRVKRSTDWANQALLKKWKSNFNITDCWWKNYVNPLSRDFAFIFQYVCLVNFYHHVQHFIISTVNNHNFLITDQYVYIFCHGSASRSRSSTLEWRIEDRLNGTILLSLRSEKTGISKKSYEVQKRCWDKMSNAIRVYVEIRCRMPLGSR